MLVLPFDGMKCEAWRSLKNSRQRRGIRGERICAYSFCTKLGFISQPSLVKPSLFHFCFLLGSFATDHQIAKSCLPIFCHEEQNVNGRRMSTGL